MFKRQKEVALYQLSEEEKVIKQLESQYRKALEDVEMVIRILMTDDMTPSRINRIGYQQKLKAQLEGVLEALHNNEYTTINAFLQDSYTDSFVGTMYDLHGQDVPMILPIDQNAAVKAIQLDAKLSERKIHPNLNGEHVTLYESLGVDVAKLKKTIRQEITRGLATGMAVKDIARNISFATKAPLNRAKTIAQTESHRIQETSKQDARHAAKANGADLVKYWDSIMDGDTRSAHRQLDGQAREVDEPFEVNGHRAMQPGGFGIPGMDIRCRCMALTRARKKLSDADLKRMQEKAKFWDLDKAESFEDFKKKYLKAAKAESEEPVITFKPAKTREEAETFAKQFASSVSYEGIALDKANTINEELVRLTRKYPIQTLNEIYVGGKGAMSASYASLSVSKTKSGAALDNSHSNFLQSQQEERERLSIMEERFAGRRMPPTIAKTVEKLKNSLRFTRHAVFDGRKDPLRWAVIHEYGHIVSDQYFGMINQEAANPNYTKNPAIRSVLDRWTQIWYQAHSDGAIYDVSKYGSTNEKEFFAECFTAREAGEKLPDYIEQFMTEVLKNGRM